MQRTVCRDVTKGYCSKKEKGVLPRDRKAVTTLVELWMCPTTAAKQELPLPSTP